MSVNLNVRLPLQLTYNAQDVNVFVDDQTRVLSATRVRILVMGAYKLTGGKNHLRVDLIISDEAKPLKIDFGKECAITLTYVNEAGTEKQTTLNVTSLTLAPSQGILIAEGQTPDLQIETTYAHTGDSMASSVSPMQPPVQVQPVQPQAMATQVQLEQLLMLKEKELYQYLKEHRDQLNSQMADMASKTAALKAKTDEMETMLSKRQSELKSVQQQMEARRSAISDIDAQIAALIQAESEREAAEKCLVDFDHATFSARVMELQEMIEVRQKAVKLYGRNASRVLDSVPNCLKQAAELVAQADKALSEVISTREQINRIIVAALDRDGCVEAAKLKGDQRNGRV